MEQIDRDIAENIMITIPNNDNNNDKNDDATTNNIVWCYFYLCTKDNLAKIAL